MTKKAETPKKTRKTNLETKVLPRLLEIAEWARTGVTEQAMAEALGISYSRFRDYKAQCAELNEVLRTNELIADLPVISSLYERCMGGAHEVKKAVKLKTVEYDGKGRRVKETEQIRYAKETVYVPADVNAIKFWLTNRMKEVFADKVPLELNGATISVDLGGAAELAE